MTLIICSATLFCCRGSEESTAILIAHPDDSEKRVEYFVETPAGEGPWPTVVLLHGHQEAPRPGGKVFVEWGVLKQIAGRGYLAVAISQPGYGGSSGPADFCGEFTQHAVSGVIARLRADGLASRDRLLIQGVSRGALTAGLVAAQDSSVSGLVLISGVYDLPAYVDDSQAGVIKQSIVRSLNAETGGTVDALKARSVMRAANRIKASTLILNGAKDDRTDPGQARALAEQITRAGGEARAVIYPEFGHQIPVKERSKVIDPFIDRVLGGTGRSKTTDRA